MHPKSKSEWNVKACKVQTYQKGRTKRAVKYDYARNFFGSSNKWWKCAKIPWLPHPRIPAGNAVNWKGSVTMTIVMKNTQCNAILMRRRVSKAAKEFFLKFNSKKIVQFFFYFLTKLNICQLFFFLGVIFLTALFRMISEEGHLSFDHLLWRKGGIMEEGRKGKKNYLFSLSQ